MRVTDRVKTAAQERWRRRRMALFFQLMKLEPGIRILDVGGLPALWKMLPQKLDVTLLNLPGAFQKQPESELERYRCIEADICRHPEIVQEYDLVFSNSVLEHVGSSRRQEAFARAVTASKAFWLQVPAPCFPLEAHCHKPFWWLRPHSARTRQIRQWHRGDRPWLARQMASTRPVGRSRMKQLFPDATIITERSMGLPKSYYAFRQ